MSEHLESFELTKPRNPSDVMRVQRARASRWAARPYAQQFLFILCALFALGLGIVWAAGGGIPADAGQALIPLGLLFLVAVAAGKPEWADSRPGKFD